MIKVFEFDPYEHMSIENKINDFIRKFLKSQGYESIVFDMSAYGPTQHIEKWKWNQFWETALNQASPNSLHIQCYEIAGYHPTIIKEVDLIIVGYPLVDCFTSPSEYIREAAKWFDERKIDRRILEAIQRRMELDYSY